MTASPLTLTCWLTTITSNTDCLTIQDPRPYATWEDAAGAAERQLLASLTDALSMHVAQAATEDALAQFADARPGRNFGVTVSAPHGNATYDWAVTVSALDLSTASPLPARLAALTQAEVAWQVDPTPDTMLVRDLAAERLRLEAERLAGQQVMDAPQFRQELEQELERAAEGSDGDVSRFEIRVSGSGDEGLTRLHVMPICDWNQPDDDTLGECGLTFAVSRDAALQLHARYLRWVVFRKTDVTGCPGGRPPTCENPAAAGQDGTARDRFA